MRVCVACGVWQYAGIGKAFFFFDEIKTVRNVLVEKTFLTVFTSARPNWMDVVVVKYGLAQGFDFALGWE